MLSDLRGLAGNHDLRYVVHEIIHLRNNEFPRDDRTGGDEDSPSARGPLQIRSNESEGEQEIVEDHVDRVDASDISPT